MLCACSDNTEEASMAGAWEEMEMGGEAGG